jgi:hypothetical protein
MGETIVTKPTPNPADPASFFLPMQRFTSVCSEIVTHDFGILEHVFFETLGEMQGLSPIHGPVEFFEQGAIFAWKNAERSLKAFNELSTEMSRFWVDAMKAATPKTKQ